MAYQPVAIVEGSDIYQKVSGIEALQSGIRVHASGQTLNQVNPDKNVWYGTDTFNLFDNRFLTVMATTDASSGAQVDVQFSGVAGWETFISGILAQNVTRQIVNDSFVLEKVKARGKVLSSGATFLRIYINAGV